MRTLYVIAVFLISATAALHFSSAQAELQTSKDVGIAVGETIPSLETVDQYGQPQSFESVKGERGAVLVFVRSADWCPYCQAQLIDLGEQGHKIEEIGYKIVVISYDSPDKQLAFTKKYEFTHTMLSDTDSKIIKAFGILNEEQRPGSTYYGIPYPGIFIVNRSGVIQDKLFEEGYKNRPPVADILDAIQNTEHL